MRWSPPSQACDADEGCAGRRPTAPTASLAAYDELAGRARRRADRVRVPVARWHDRITRAHRHRPRAGGERRRRVVRVSRPTPPGRERGHRRQPGAARPDRAPEHLSRRRHARSRSPTRATPTRCTSRSSARTTRSSPMPARHANASTPGSTPTSPATPTSSASAPSRSATSRACGGRPSPAWSSARHRSPTRRTPTFVMTADTDPATPTVNAMRVFGRLDDAYLVVLQGGPHVIFDWGYPCVDDLVANFLGDGTVPETRVTICDAFPFEEYVPIAPDTPDELAALAGDPLGDARQHRRPAAAEPRVLPVGRRRHDGLRLRLRGHRHVRTHRRRHRHLARRVRVHRRLPGERRPAHSTTRRADRRCR